MQRRTHLGDLVIFASRIHAVREQNHKQLAVWIDPNRSPGETGMPKAVRRKIMAAGAALGWHDPAERPRAFC